MSYCLIEPRDTLWLVASFESPNIHTSGENQRTVDLRLINRLHCNYSSKILIFYINNLSPMGTAVGDPTAIPWTVGDSKKSYHTIDCFLPNVVLIFPIPLNVCYSLAVRDPVP